MVDKCALEIEIAVVLMGLLNKACSRGGLSFNHTEPEDRGSRAERVKVKGGWKPGSDGLQIIKVV